MKTVDYDSVIGIATNVLSISGHFRWPKIRRVTGVRPRREMTRPPIIHFMKINHRPPGLNNP